MRRRTLIAGAGAALALSSPPALIRAQGTLEKIRLAAIPSDALTPLYYGLEKGLFRDAGIDLQIIPAMNGTAATTAVIAGTYEIANTSLLPLFTAYLRDIPIRIVAPQAVYTPENPFGLLQIAADASYKKAADLNGKVCAVSALNDLSDLGIKAWVDQTGGDSKTLQFVEIPASATGEALAQHRVAAGILLEPVLDESIAAGQTKTLANPYQVIAKKFMFAAYVGRPDWARQNLDLLRRFNRAAGDAAVYTNAHPAATAAMMSAITKVPLPIMQRMRRVVCATSLDPALVQPFIDVSAKYKSIPKAFPAQSVFFEAS